MWFRAPRSELRELPITIRVKNESLQATRCSRADIINFSVPTFSPCFPGPLHRLATFVAFAFMCLAC